MRKAVVSAIITMDKQRDELGPFTKMPGWDYILFINTETKLTGTFGWDVRTIPTVGTMGAHTSKHVKWLTHTYLPDYDQIIWVDAHIVPNPDKQAEIEAICLKLQETPSIPFALLRHPCCGSARADIDSCVTGHKCSVETAKRTIEVHKSEGFPDKYGDFWSCMVIRNNKSEQFHAFGTVLMDKILNVAHRDQFWIAYTLWKLNCEMPYCFHESLFRGSGRIVNHSYV